jgi:hypothetical protein
VPLPVPVAVEPLLNVTVHAPVAVTFPVILALAPAHIVVGELVIAAVGRVFTVITALPVIPEETATQFISLKDATV